MTSYWLAYRGTRFPLRTGETILGRSAYSTIVIRNARVSREHAALRVTGDRIELSDLGSTNGTTVNGEAVIGSRLLSPGDKLGIGTDVLELIADEGPGRLAQTTSKIDPAEVGATRTEAPSSPEEASLELIEALVGIARDAGRTDSAGKSVKRAIDHLMKRSRAHLVGPERDRLVSAARALASWYPDGSLDEWRDWISAELERTKTR